MAVTPVKFSIITPTRNRASSLVHAIRSALAQSLDDYEIIVSNNNSSDDTEAVVRRFDSPRLRSYRTDRDLPMADHWEFALEKASGAWVLFLCDDDALLPDCLEVLDQASRRDRSLQVLQYEASQYVYDDGIESRGNYIKKYHRPSGGAFDVVDSARQLRAVFHSMSGDMPKFLNAAVRQDLIGRLRDRSGRVFRRWSPDYAAGVTLLAHTPRFGRINTPLLLWGKNVRSYGSGSYVNPGHLLEFLREYKEFEGRLDFSPYPNLISVNNMVYDTLAMTREALGDPLRHLSVDRLIFLQHLRRDIAIYLAGGHADYRRHEEIVLRDLGALSRPLSTRLVEGRRRLIKNARRLARSLSGSGSKDRIIAGDRSGAEFSNIYEAAQSFRRHRD